jgi:phosphoribosylanthranilate isomerase
VFVKICGITRPADAIAAVDAGADAIGLNFVPTSRRRIDVETARAILAVVTDQVMTVGIFRDHPANEILEITGALGLHAAQLHGDEPPEVTAAVVATGVATVIKSVAAESPSIRSIDEHAADIVLLDAPIAGGGVPFDWDTVGDLVTKHKILLAGGLGPDNIAEAVRRVRPWGVDVASGVEAEPPQKDPDAIARFVAAAHAAAHQPTGSRTRRARSWLHRPPRAAMPRTRLRAGSLCARVDGRVRRCRSDRCPGDQGYPPHHRSPRASCDHRSSSRSSPAPP